MYSDRTLSSVSETIKDDQKIQKYEKERLKGVERKCRKLYFKATGIQVEKDDFLDYCKGKYKKFY